MTAYQHKSEMSKYRSIFYNKVVLVEDNSDIARQIANALATEGISVLKLRSAEHLLDLRISVSAILLNRCLSNNCYSSLRVLETMRANGDRTPVIIISSLTSAEERVKGLKAGADDCIDQPFSTAELLARVEAVRRRHDMIRTTRLTCGPLSIDRINRVVYLNTKTLELLPQEFKLLEFFMLNEGSIVPRRILLETVWKTSGNAKTNTIDVSIGNLRKKIGVNHGQLIANVRGQGFRFGYPSCGPQYVFEECS